MKTPDPHLRKPVFQHDWARHVPIQEVIDYLNQLLEQGETHVNICDSEWDQSLEISPSHGDDRLGDRFYEAAE